MRPIRLVPAAEADLVREPGQVVTEILLHDLAVVLASYGTQIHLEGFLHIWISVPAGPGYGAAEPRRGHHGPVTPGRHDLPDGGAPVRPDTAGPNTPDSWKLMITLQGN